MARVLARGKRSRIGCLWGRSCILNIIIMQKFSCYYLSRSVSQPWKETETCALKHHQPPPCSIYTICIYTIHTIHTRDHQTCSIEPPLIDFRIGRESACDSLIAWATILFTQSPWMAKLHNVQAQAPTILMQKAPMNTKMQAYTLLLPRRIRQLSSLRKSSDMSSTRDAKINSPAEIAFMIPTTNRPTSESGL